MVKIFTVDSPFSPGVPNLASLTRQAEKWEASQAIDQVLVGYSALWPHNFATAPTLFALTRRVGLIVAHRPGVMHPTAAARWYGTMDVLSGGGRLACNLVSGSSDKDLHREGDYEIKAVRYERATDYVACMKQCWSAPAKFDYDGKFYKAETVQQFVRPVSGHVPIYMGGDSEDAIDFGAHHADIYMLWGEPLAGTQERIRKVTEVARKYHRVPEFSLSLRLFIGETEDAAWEKARAVETTILQAQGTNRFMRSSKNDQSVGRSRQLSFADEEIHDACFWTGLVKLLGGFANSAALVGTHDQVMRSLRAYRDLGIGAFLITGGAEGLWDPSLEEFLVQAKAAL
ncbi:LLM class flavin-dependent oxidoreductase [Lichenicoccus sp.]|uniref:LLM class flavin-dependent oxidoreductase n=1 Tax=Lichenicoccus sp. TaxID=2781899 RepID=UPI003D0F02B9